ncbi:MAG: APC family permease, partial [Verrucomicrobiota bacterium]|nr:APC family permease [Verrucomicrobiota bacterium]
MVFFVIINALGAAAFARANTAITWLKLAIPVLVAIALFTVRFEPGNFHAHGGFAPYGLQGILAAVTNGGVVFALIGFRHAIDMAGEARNPRVTVPVALLIGLLLPTGIYLLIQAAFLGALMPGDLGSGWHEIHFGSRLGPLAAVSMALGISWISVAIYGGAILGPLGGGLVSTGSNGRLGYALARNHFLPGWFEKLSGHSIPMRTLWLNFAIGMALLMLLPFRGIISVNSAAITLSFTAGPLAVYALRKQLPDTVRSFRLRAMPLQALLGFVIATFIIYWSGWQTTKVLLSVICVSILFLAIKRLWIDRHPFKSLDRREAIWLIPFVATTTIVSFLGNFGGGRGIIPFGWDLGILGVASVINFTIAVWCRLPNDKAAAYRERYRNPDIPVTPSDVESE